MTKFRPVPKASLKIYRTAQDNYNSTTQAEGPASGSRARAKSICSVISSRNNSKLKQVTTTFTNLKIQQQLINLKKYFLNFRTGLKLQGIELMWHNSIWSRKYIRTNEKLVCIKQYRCGDLICGQGNCKVQSKNLILHLLLRETAFECNTQGLKSSVRIWKVWPLQEDKLCTDNNGRN